LRKRCARSRRSVFGDGSRAAVFGFGPGFRRRRASRANSLRAATIVALLTPAALASAFTLASGFACWSAARARSRASVCGGARRLCLRRRPPRPRGRPARLRQRPGGPGSRRGSLDPGAPELRSNGANTAARIWAAVFGCRLRTASLAVISAMRSAGSMATFSCGGIRTIIPRASPRKAPWPQPRSAIAAVPARRNWYGRQARGGWLRPSTGATPPKRFRDGVNCETCCVP
jgi:hypothetical protein